MKRLVAAVLVLFLAVSISQAGVITLSNSTLDALGGVSSVAIDTVQSTAMTNGGTQAMVANQAYLGDNDLYIYLYQVDNTGLTAIEMYRLWPFEGADDQTDMGWLADKTPPAGFAAGGQIPESTGYVSSGSSGSVVSFYYSKRVGHEIEVNEHSAVMYVVSELPPDTVNGNIIGGTVGTGVVVGAVPEPATALYLILGGLSLLVLYRRR